MLLVFQKYGWVNQWAWKERGSATLHRTHDPGGWGCRLGRVPTFSHKPVALGQGHDLLVPGMRFVKNSLFWHLWLCWWAIIMDTRVWHGGTENKSDMARPMLSVHNAGPMYTEEVLRDGGSIPFFGTCYWCYHRGALHKETWKSLSPLGQELCNDLVWDETSVSCYSCKGRSALRSIGSPGGPWLCLQCWAHQKATLLWCWGDGEMGDHRRILTVLILISRNYRKPESEAWKKGQPFKE